MELFTNIIFSILIVLALMLINFLMKKGFNALKDDIYHLLIVWIFAGVIIGQFGLVSSGAGHGPFPELSIIIMFAGIIVAALAFIWFVLLSAHLIIKKYLINNA